MSKKFLFLLFILPLGLYAGLPHKSHSVLESGRWFRISLQTTGIYKLTYQDFQAMGFDPAGIDPSRIQLYGNGSGMLPEINNASRADDLTENPIFVQDGGDGKFDTSDYVLFYGESPDQWVLDYDTRLFTHSKNLYSDSTYYYITIGTIPGKRVQSFASLDSVPDYTTTWSMDHQVHEIDSVNLIQSGKAWFGEYFSADKNEYSIPFTFPNADSGTAAKIVTHVAAKSTLTSKFILTDSKSFSDSIGIGDSNPAGDRYAVESTKVSYLLNPHPSINIKIHYEMNEPGGIGWLDYLEVHCKRSLSWTPPQMSFRDPIAVRIPVTEYRLKGTNSSLTIWDVTHRNDIKKIIPVATDTTLKFRISSDSLREFIAFDGSSFYTVHLSGPVANQDLHSLEPANLIIVTNPLFREQADSLADFHRTTQGLTVHVVDVYQIYNEFACGQKDLTAIRDFMKMLYDRAGTGKEPRYLLFFGDASYDYKNLTAEDNNLVPT